MLDIDNADKTKLAELALSYSIDENSEEIYQRALRGFKSFGSPEIKKRYYGNDHQRYLEEGFRRIVENWEFCFRDATVWGEPRTQSLLLSLLRKYQCPSEDIEDHVNNLVLKWLRCGYAEAYNPLIANWSTYLGIAVKNWVISVFKKRKRTPTSVGVSLHSQNVESGVEYHSDPCPSQVDPSPYEWLVFQEALVDFEEWLLEQESFRTIVFKGYKKLVTLLPPGMPSVPLKKPQCAYLVRQGRTKQHRVHLNTGRELLWDISKCKRIRTNPKYDPAFSQPLYRSPYKLYKVLTGPGNPQVDDVASILQVGDSTVHLWIHQLEDLFRRWWSQSEVLSPEVREIAYALRCPGCGATHTQKPEPEKRLCTKVEQNGETRTRINVEGVYQYHHWCPSCDEWALVCDLFAYSLPVPWGTIRGSHRIKARSEKYRSPWTIPQCVLATKSF